MKKERLCFQIHLTFIDEKNCAFVVIGVRGFETVADQRASFDAIPRHPDYKASRFVADLMDADGVTVIDGKPVSAEVCEAFIGRPIAELIEVGRANTTCYTGCDLKEKYPELKEKYPDMFMYELKSRPNQSDQ